MFSKKIGYTLSSSSRSVCDVYKKKKIPLNNSGRRKTFKRLLLFFARVNDFYTLTLPLFLHRSPFPACLPSHKPFRCWCCQEQRRSRRVQKRAQGCGHGQRREALVRQPEIIFRNTKFFLLNSFKNRAPLC